MLRGSKIGRSLRGKVFTFVFAQTRIRPPKRKPGLARSADPVKKDNSRYLVLLDAHVATNLGAVVEDLAARGAQLAAHVVEEDRLQERTHAGRHVAHAVLKRVEHHDRVGVRVEECKCALLHGATLA